MQDLEQRMKENYENREKHFLPRRTNTIIRVDGKKFSKYTKGFNKPYDEDLLHAMESTMLSMLEELQGVQFAYTQSDEISFFLKDDRSETTQAYFDGNVQKIASVTASLATGYFNQYVSRDANRDKPAFFDSRVFTIPDPVEVENYFIWRNKDAIRNAVQTYGRYILGHSQLQNKSTRDIILELEESSDYNANFKDEDSRFWNGTMAHLQYNEEKERYKWNVTPAFNFTEHRQEFIHRLFPESSTVYGTPE